MQDRSLNRLFDHGIPALHKGNIGMQSSPHVYDTNHEPALVTVAEDDISFPEKVFTVHDDNEQSMLLKKLGKNDAFEYQTESEVQYLVQLALEDALESLGLTGLLHIKPEISVFAYRPDIIVVYHSMRGIVLVVEVKKPGTEVFESHDVGGQLYDYLVGLLGTGILPFGVLSSYDETCIAYLDDGGVSKGILERVIGQLNSEIPQSRVLGDADVTIRSASAGVTRSPESKLRRVFTRHLTGIPTGGACLKTEEDVDAQDGRDGDEETTGSKLGKVDGEDAEKDPIYEREIIYTTTFSGRNAMKGLILAIRCAIESLNVSQEKDVPLNGDGATGACALVNESGLCWTKLSSSVKFDYYNFPPSSSKLFYLWKDLGRGSKGRVFLACNSTGKVCAAKFLLLDQTLLHRQEDSPAARRAERERQMEARKVLADLECSRWTEAYNGIFGKQVRVVKLNNLWCLLMPYFDPVQLHERMSVLPAVKTILSDFKKKGLRYADDDLRWRHIGMRDGRVYLFDLGSLEVDDPKKKTTIDAQISHLSSKTN
ncbi:hypothetical protein IV203_035112 [Nitzschia inconspicua]|uniref:DUF5898 domain-containing protein n=1 Tax=Nitzschia inconspicua TaxID=303405 RepID=A0A9K3PWT8_9STRA|nr:hypothetical protein IV203_035112 [Nitzschia inconspicua]